MDNTLHSWVNVYNYKNCKILKISRVYKFRYDIFNILLWINVSSLFPFHSSWKKVKSWPQRNSVLKQSGVGSENQNIP